MSDNNIQIGVIDDGINEKLYNIKLNNNIEIMSDLTIVKREEYNAHAHSHATTCAAIINKYADDVVLTSIKVLDHSTQRGLKDQLITGLKWCVNNNIKVINMSLGTIDFRDFDELIKCINHVVSKNIIIIAACSNKNVYTYPACHSSVIGVKCRRIYLDDTYMFNEYAYDGIDISASGRHNLEDVYGNKRYTNPSNSMAAPLITAKVINILKGNMKMSGEEIKKALYKDAVNNKHVDGYNPYLNISLDWMTEEANVSYDDTNNNLIVKNGMRIWSSARYEEILINNLKTKYNLDIPIIYLFDRLKGRLLLTIDRIYNLFKKDGYYCVCATNNSISLLHGFEYMPEQIHESILISNVYKKYNCDVIIVGICSDIEIVDGYFKDEVLADIEVY